MKALVPCHPPEIQPCNETKWMTRQSTLETLSLVDKRVMILSVSPMTALVAGTKHPRWACRYNS